MGNIKTKEVELEGKKITIWKMNLGFRTDYQGDTTETVWRNEGNRRIRDVVVHNGKLLLMTLVYGIYKSEDLGIKEPKDLSMGLSPEEKESRIKIIRELDFDIDKLYEEIQEFNTEVEEEVLKK